MIKPIIIICEKCGRLENDIPRMIYEKADLIVCSACPDCEDKMTDYYSEKSYIEMTPQVTPQEPPKL